MEEIIKYFWIFPILLFIIVIYFIYHFVSVVYPTYKKVKDKFPDDDKYYILGAICKTLYKEFKKYWIMVGMSPILIIFIPIFFIWYGILSAKVTAKYLVEKVGKDQLDNFKKNKKLMKEGKK